MPAFIDRETFRRPVKMTEGVNALALQPEIIPKPQLRIVKLGAEVRAPTKIEDFLKKGQISIGFPQQADALSRQQIIGGTPEAELERFIESEMDEEKPWSAFGQLIFTKEHTLPSGEKIKKWIGFSISYPGGVGERMTQEILRKTLDVKDSDFDDWDGAEEGKIIATHKPVPDVMQELDLMDRFVDISEQVIRGSHAQVDHKIVQHFMDLQPARRGFLEEVKKDAAAMLMNPEFEGKSVLQEKYFGKGYYLMGGAMKMQDGKWCGPNLKGELVPVLDVVTNEHHFNSVTWIENKIKKTIGDSVTGDGDSTEDVHFCGGAKDNYKRGCSEIFQTMERGIRAENEITTSEYSSIRGIAASIAASETSRVTSGGGVAGRYDSETCSTCGKDKFIEGGCKCSTEKA